MSEIDKIVKPEQYGILLPCTPETFADFVSGLLGASQTIERAFYGVFELTRSGLENTFHLVDQRVRQQNDASLVEFSVKIFYNDDSSVLLNSWNDFNHYNEVRPLVSVGAHLTWVYLIRFQGKQVPERQQIEITFQTKAASRHDQLQRQGFPISPRLLDASDRIGLRIAHTARTWGVDIESLLSGHINSLKVRDARWRAFVFRNSGTIGFITGLLIFAGSLLGMYYATDRFTNAQMEVARDFLSSATLTQRVDFLVNKLSSGEWSKFFLLQVGFFLASILGSVILGVWVGSAAEIRRPSFVLLSKEAEVDRVHKLAALEKSWIVFFVAVLVSISCDIVANVIFNVFVAKGGP